MCVRLYIYICRRPAIFYHAKVFRLPRGKGRKTPVYVRRTRRRLRGTFSRTSKYRLNCARDARCRDGSPGCFRYSFSTYASRASHLRVTLTRLQIIRNLRLTSARAPREAEERLSPEIITASGGRGRVLRREMYMLSVVYASLQAGLISLSRRGTKWIVKKEAVFRLNAPLPDKAIKF